MAEKSGSIEYGVEVETSQLLKAQKIAETSVDKIASSFVKADKAIKLFQDRIKDSGKTINDQGQVISKNGKVVFAATRQYQELIKKLNQTEKAFANSGNGGKKANNALAGVSKGAGQAGIQVQQFIGQIQGGQSAILAFSQQSADLGFVLGFPLAGAVSGIAASLVGILLPALFKTSEATKDFSFNVKESAKELEILDDLSRAQVSVAIQKTNKSMTDLSKEADKAGDKIAVLNQKLDAGEKVNVRITKTGRAIIENIKLTEKETKKLTEELAKEQANLDVISQEYKRQSDLLVKLSKNTDGLTKKEQEQVKSLKDLEQSLKAQTIALKDGEEAAFRFATAQQLGLKVGEQIPSNLDAQISAHFRLIKVKKLAREGDAATKTLKGQVSSIGLTPEENITARFERQNELLIQAREKDILTEESFLSRKEELEKQHEDKLKRLRDKGSIDAILNFEALENQAIGTFASIASGAQDGKTAIKSLAQSILTQIIGALIKMGIQAVIGQTTVAATTVATAGVMSTALAAPAALMSLATAGANAIPASAGIASTVGLAQGLALSGGREHGGPVQAGKMFQVGEGGKPEIFTSGGKNFMIPGDNGRVTSNNDAFGSQKVEMNVNIENNVSNANVQTKMSEDGKNLRIFINEVANQINNNQGPIPKAMRNSTNTTFKANR